MHYHDCESQLRSENKSGRIGKEHTSLKVSAAAPVRVNLSL